MDPEAEPTKHEVKEVKGRIGVPTGHGRRDRNRNRSGVDQGTLRAGLLDYIEDEFRVRLGQGQVGSSGGAAAWAGCAGLFAALDVDGDGTVTHAEFQ